MNDLEKLLANMVRLNASDLHLNHGSKISYRIDGQMEQMGPIITGEQVFQVVLPALSSEQQRTYHMNKHIDFSYELEGARFRGNLYKQKGQHSCVFRKIDGTIIPLDQLDLPAVIKDLVRENWGMILVTGPTGSGKSTTLASIIDHINETRKCHIATIEEPLEYIHKDKKAVVTQREVGKDSESFAESMRAILRHDPDVILVGEMRDWETISAAVTNAETGHLVLATLHNNTAPQAITRIVDVYPVEQQNSVRGQLAESIKMIINQRLLPKEGGGRVALYEILVVDAEIKELIRAGKINLIHEVMKRKPHAGNMLMEDAYKKAEEQGLLIKNKGGIV